MKQYFEQKRYFLFYLLCLWTHSFGVDTLQQQASKVFIETTDFSPENKNTLNQMISDGSVDPAAFDFTDIDIIDKDLSGLCLRGAKFKNCKLIKVNLNNTDLTDTDFEGATFEEATIDRIKLQPGWVIKDSFSPAFLSSSLL